MKTKKTKQRIQQIEEILPHETYQKFLDFFKHCLSERGLSIEMFFRLIEVFRSEDGDLYNILWILRGGSYGKGYIVKMSALEDMVKDNQDKIYALIEIPGKLLFAFFDDKDNEFFKFYLDVFCINTHDKLLRPFIYDDELWESVVFLKRRDDYIFNTNLGFVTKIGGTEVVFEEYRIGCDYCNFSFSFPMGLRFFHTELVEGKPKMFQSEIKPVKIVEFNNETLWIELNTNIYQDIYKKPLEEYEEIAKLYFDHAKELERKKNL